MQCTLTLPNSHKRIKLLAGVTMRFNHNKREITYIADDPETLKWQLLVNMSERDAIKLLKQLEIADNL